MIKKFTPYVIAIIILAALLAGIFSWRAYNKNKQTPAVQNDSITIVNPQQQHSINLPHADTALIPILTKILTDAFDASAKKDYIKLASYMVYRGPDQQRFGNDIYNAKHNDEKALVKITSDVFNKWNTGIDTRDYTRVFNYDQPNAKSMLVLEVIFVSKKNINRKFFGFMKINDEYKIADVTSEL